jgi:Photoprotection regulator fluorescence recovery protein
MSTSPRPIVRDTYTDMRNLKWSPEEKKIARKAFDLALHQELEELIAKAKRQAAKIHQPAELWNLEHFLGERRKEIDQKYDYRYSVLPMVFGILIREGRISEEDLQGLNEDKLGYIRRYVRL